MLYQSALPYRFDSSKFASVRSPADALLLGNRGDGAVLQVEDCSGAILPERGGIGRWNDVPVTFTRERQGLFAYRAFSQEVVERSFFKFSQNLHHYLVLILQMQKDRFYFPLCFRVNLKVSFCSRFGMPALQVLPYHNQRHEEDLNHI